MNLISRFSMREKWALGMKFGALVLCIAVAMRGRPPATAQDRQMPADPVPAVQAVEDAYQDRDIAYLKVLYSGQEAKLITLQTQIASIALQQNTTDTQIRVFLWIIATLTAGGFGLQLYRNKAS